MPQLPREDSSWFDQVSPNLLRNKAIRQYFAKYTTAEWPELLKLTMLYGILALHKSHGGKTLTLNELRDTLARGHLSITLEAALPDVYDQLDKLQGQLGAISQDIYDPVQAAKQEPAAPASANMAVPAYHQHQVLAVPQVLPEASRAVLLPEQHAAVDDIPQHQITRLQSPHQPPVAPGQIKAAAAARAVAARRQIPEAARVRRSSYPVVAPLPSSGWRDGDADLTWSPPGRKRSPGRDRAFDGVPAPAGPVYPSWWGDGSDAPPPPRTASPQPARQPKPPPRLAYTVQQSMEAPLWQDDLVTAKYLDAAGSGYAQQPAHTQIAPAKGVAVHANQADIAHAAKHPPQMSAPVAGPAPAPAAHPFAFSAQPNMQQHPPLQPPVPAMLSHTIPGPAAAAAAGVGSAAGTAPQPVVPAAQHQVLYALQPDGLMMPVLVPAPAMPADERQQQQQGQGQRGSVVAQPNTKDAAKRLNLAAVESRIKAQVAADRAHAQQQGAARQRAIMAVLTPPVRKGPRGIFHQPPPALATPSTNGPTPPRSQPPGASPATHQASPSDLADSLASNPWTSWFMGTAQQGARQMPPGTSLGVVPGTPLSETSSDAAGPVQPAPKPMLSYDNPLADVYDQGVAVGGPRPGVPAGIAGAWAAMHAGLESDSSMSMSNNMNAGSGAQGLAPSAAWGTATQAAGAVEATFKLRAPESGNAADKRLHEAAGVPAPSDQPKSVYPLRGGMKWELDENTLEDIAASKQQSRARGSTSDRSYPGVRQEVARWSKTWVGDFGHLEHTPRFDFEHPFQHHQQQDEAQEERQVDAADKELGALRARLAEVREGDSVATSASLNRDERAAQQLIQNEHLSQLQRVEPQQHQQRAQQQRVQQQVVQQQQQQQHGIVDIRTSLDDLQARLRALQPIASLSYPSDPSSSLGMLTRPAPNLVTTGLPVPTIMAPMSDGTSEETSMSATSSPRADTATQPPGGRMPSAQQQHGQLPERPAAQESLSVFGVTTEAPKSSAPVAVMSTPVMSSLTAYSMLLGPSTDSSQAPPSHSSTGPSHSAAGYPAVNSDPGVLPFAWPPASVTTAPAMLQGVPVRQPPQPPPPAPAPAPGPGPAPSNAPIRMPTGVTGALAEGSLNVLAGTAVTSNNEHAASQPYTAAVQGIPHSVFPAATAASLAGTQGTDSQAVLQGSQQSSRVVSGVTVASSTAAAAGMSLSALAALARKDLAEQQQQQQQQQLSIQRQLLPALEQSSRSLGNEQQDQQQPPALGQGTEHHQQEQQAEEQQRREQLQQLLQEEEEDEEQQQGLMMSTVQGLDAIIEDEEGYVETVETSSTTTEELLKQSEDVVAGEKAFTPGSDAQRESVGSIDVSIPGPDKAAEGFAVTPGSDDGKGARFQAWGTDSPSDLTPMSDGELERITNKLSEEAAKLGYQAYLS